ncbi:3-hydroxyacyl-CoA dehydrogenase NAD-binding domain-containing protein [Salinibacterium sp. G-O1]|uniref:3-hydroxyacyl-CoA dehydrogenase NAD-binding domain-containing protein n=1 Tax=Salinibacterium sp. G-O1 TaxID=3046208 RepID=UPI0024B9A44B|nr:3-hydroxyacyl-CoA dehydrogenase NAD-binding domain-containing protein [Salinibacterium sp. G-O1]MDJ0334008.1 3-hydroxyacyl-CoA dehydrogenase NAD-binding domain-containing protein [Salinibacterium sp. G-O1]
MGVGTIGVGWAVVFGTGGCNVRAYDSQPAMLERFLSAVEFRLTKLAEAGLISEDVATVLDRIAVVTSREDVIRGANHVQESVTESVEVKRDLFAWLDEATPPDVTLASSTSTIPSSRFTSGLPGRDRCLVVHPANPPYLLRVAEVVPSEYTSDATTDNAVELLRSVRMSPVVVRNEIEGFVFNRLQGALLREAYFLVGEGVVTPRDLDTLVRDGLGRRWSITGPFATSELNTRGGTARHAEVNGSVYARIGSARGAGDPWIPETIAYVMDEMNEVLPGGDWEANVLRRELAMIKLEGLRHQGDVPSVIVEN